MKRIKKILAGLIACFGLLFLAACSNNSSGISEKNVDMQITTTKDKATIKLTFDENENIKSSVLYIVCYKVVDGADNYHTKQNVSFSNSVYTSSTVEFKSLASKQEYKFILYVTFNGTDEKIVEKTATTSSTVSTEIASVDDFKNKLGTEKYDYTLTSDLDFGGDSINLFNTDSSQFIGTIDGGIYDADGNLTGCHKITNYKLSSSKYMGLLGNVKGASLKNLIIEDVTVEVSRSDAFIGSLFGYAERTSVNNVTIKNVSYKITASSSAEHFTGGVVGKSVGSAFDSVEATNVSINYTSARIKVSVGLFAGALLGEGLENVTAKSCGAEGSLTVVAEYSLSSTSDYADYIYVGGFAGQIGSNGTINDCYSKVDATYSMKQQARKFDLFMGGFVGGNTANIRITNSLAIATLKAYAGLTPTDGDGHNYENELVASQNAYVGGFIGNASGSIYGIRNSYSKLLAETVAEGKSQNDDGDTVLFVDSFKAKVSDSVSAEAFDGSSTITTEKPENLSEKLKGLLA